MSTRRLEIKIDGVSFYDQQVDADWALAIVMRAKDGPQDPSVSPGARGKPELVGKKPVQIFLSRLSPAGRQFVKGLSAHAKDTTTAYELAEILNRANIAKIEDAEAFSRGVGRRATGVASDPAVSLSDPTLLC